MIIRENGILMLKRFRYMIMLAIVLFSALSAGAQMIPDFVHIGATKNYWVDSIAGSNSKYIWKIAGEEKQNGSIDLLKYKWDSPGAFTISVQEFSADGCPGPIQTGEVYVYQVTLPDPLVACVENIQNAYYNTVTKEIVIEHRDYYTFKPGDTKLDLSPSNFADLIPSSCPVEIHWQIDFSPTPDPITHNLVTKPSVSGTGQPSAYGSEILFPGDGVDFNNVVHTITYQIVDCHGNISYSKSQTITIKPRPKIL